MNEYKSFLKTVKAGEGDRCHYPTRLDPYGCGCQHDCSYCYAKSLLEFRGLWNPKEPRVADIDKIRGAIEKLPQGLPPIRLSPYLEGNIDKRKIASFKPDKVIVEFLRINHWITKWFDVDESLYTVENGGYKHLPLSEKLEQVMRLYKALPDTQISVCEDEPEAYEYWKRYFNPNPDDCCNLTQSVHW